MNGFGRIFRINILGESHGEGVGVSIDGCPAGIALSSADFEKDISRRKPTAKGTTPRKEADIPQFLTGVFEGYTTGAPLTIWFENKNVRSTDYEKQKKHFRPGHADFTAWKKHYGFNDYRGGGHFSGRLTLGLVAAGVVAKKIIPHISIQGKIENIGGTSNFDETITEAIAHKDSIGGIVACTATGVPIALGEPFFDSIESVISHLAFSIPGIKAIAFGDGAKAASSKGSDFNDTLINAEGETKTNHSGGINGGITNGNPLYFEITVKPTSSIPKPQETFNFETSQIETLKIKGRHDSCIVLRVPVIAESITAIALADFSLLKKRSTL